MQTKAILEAASENNTSVDILIPMITKENQFFQIKNIIDKIAKDYKFTNYQIGAMIENAAMANDVDVIAPYADFISFGTNDLTESVTGLSRHSGKEDFIILNAKVKDIIKESIYRARIANPNISIGFCGEHSSQLDNIEFMKSIGADYISCISSFVPTAKSVFANIEKELVYVFKKR